MTEASLGAARAVLIFVGLLWIATAARAEDSKANVFWLSQPIAPGDVISVYGDGLLRLRNAVLQRLIDDPVRAGEEGPAIAVAAEQASNESALVRAPASLAPGAYILKDSDSSRVALVNAPKVYWIQGDAGQTARVGGWVRIIGNSIALREGALARLRFADGASRVLRLADASKWDARLDLPPDVAPGTYDVDIWNGYGDVRTWAAAGAITVEPAMEAKRPFRELGPEDAGGDGLQEVLDQASAAGGGVVRLRPGVYRFSKTLRIPVGVALQGSGTRLTSLIWTKQGSTDDVIVGETRFTLSDFTLFAGEHGHVISGGFTGGTDEPRDISLVNVTVRASTYRGHVDSTLAKERLDAQLRFSTGGSDSVRLSGRNLKITGCEIYGSGRSLFLLNPRFAFVSRNIFDNGRLGWYSLTGSDGVIFEDNAIRGADLMSTGGGLNTLDKRALFSRNVIMLRNTFSNMNGADREAFTSDGPGGAYVGRISASTGRTVALPLGVSTEAVTPGLNIFVIGGRGRGQSAGVVRAVGREVLIDREWKTPPDPSSVVVIGKLHENYVLADNQFVDTGIAAQFYGAAVNHVVAGNRAVRTGGFLSYALNYRSFQPNWFIQFLENKLESSLTYDVDADQKIEWRQAWLGVWAVHRGPDGAPMVLAPVIRRNVLDRNAKILMRRPFEAPSAIEGALVQSNVFAGPIQLDVADTTGAFVGDNRSSETGP